jgi:biotin transport system substrate-specific component
VSTAGVHLQSRRPLVLSDLVPGALGRDVLLIGGGAALVGLAAQLSLPLPGTPVPVTGQTFAVLLAGAALGWRRALPSMGLYLLAGMAGVPWFAGHSSGVHAPSLGYVIGFVLAGSVVGALAARGGDRTPVRTVLTMVLGTLLIYAVGAPYLMADLHLSATAAWRAGVRPFLVGDALKVLLAAGLLPGAWGLTGRGRGGRRAR